MARDEVRHTINIAVSLQTASRLHSISASIVTVVAPKKSPRNILIKTTINNAFSKVGFLCRFYLVSKSKKIKMEFFVMPSKNMRKRTLHINSHESFKKHSGSEVLGEK